MFVAVAEEGSFTRAADRLHVVQSAVSAGVRNLERELDARLFDRSTHKVALSDAGRALLPEARATLAAAAAARDAVDAVRGAVRGTIMLGNLQAQGMRSVEVAGMLAQFRSEHPGVEIQIRQGKVHSRWPRRSEKASWISRFRPPRSTVFRCRAGPAGQ